jgi:membrane-bound ClpP family serine protease
VVSKGELIDANEKIKVVEVEGNRIVVEKDRMGRGV